MVQDLSGAGAAEKTVEEFEEYEKDQFDLVLEAQRKMQEYVFPHIQDLSFEEQMLINTKAMIHEVIETENELNWKHWKKDQLVDKEKVKSEVVDQFIFLLNQVNICKMTADELVSKTLDKISLNVDRQLSGY